MFKGLWTYHSCFNIVNGIEDSSYSGTIAEWMMSYMAMTLTTTLWCTIFILYRIISVTGSGYGVEIHSYRRVIEALVESAALYSTIYIINIVCVARNLLYGSYVEILAAAIRVCLLQY